MGFLIGLLTGIIVAIFIVPIFLMLFIKYKKYKIKKWIKKELEKGRLLTPLDKRDYDYNNWKDYINADKEQQELLDLPAKIFKRGKYCIPEEEEHSEFFDSKSKEIYDAVDPKEEENNSNEDLPKVEEDNSKIEEKEFYDTKELDDDYNDYYFKSKERKNE